MISLRGFRNGLSKHKMTFKLKIKQYKQEISSNELYKLLQVVFKTLKL